MPGEGFDSESFDVRLAVQPAKGREVVSRYEKEERGSEQLRSRAVVVEGMTRCEVTTLAFYFVQYILKAKS
jgi:hypothetical protein